jgi:hypothetical protein
MPGNIGKYIRSVILKQRLINIIGILPKFARIVRRQ